jgi:membrane protease subunit HflC
MSSRIIIPVIVVMALTAYFSLFRVYQWEQAIVFRFREIEHSTTEPGLHFMIPWVNTVHYMKWRISNVENFYTATRGGDIGYANDLLGQRINRALRDEFGRRTVQEVVAGARGEILDIVQSTTDMVQDELGIEIVDVRTKKIDLPGEVSTSVYDRMRAERARVAKDFRARGGEAAERIKANADREREVILAEAYKDAETIRGEGDAQATEIYASAYGKNPEFFSFYRSLDAYQNSFQGNSDILLLQPDSEFFKYFQGQQGR